MPADRPELQELVENPTERLDLELKDWIDIVNDGAARASIARHVAALANHGGGYLIFGFRDNRAPNPVLPFPLAIFERDNISSIVRRYLTPAFQCEVDFVTSRAGVTHPVVWVPSHAGVPICCRADGPQDARGRPQGIAIGTYYIRAPGPESAPITMAEQWQPLIRRCVLHERTSLVTMIDSLLRPVPPGRSTDMLKRWHERADARFVELASQRTVSPQTLQSRQIFSYSVRTSDGQLLDPGRLIAELQEFNREVHDLVAQPHLFYPFMRPEFAPYFVDDSESGQDNRELLESAVFEDTPFIIRRTDFWRVSLNGFAAQVLPFWEDRQDMIEHTGLEAGSWFCPYFLIRSLAELTRHARAFASRFASVETVQFRCEWNGLANRELFDPTLRIGGWLPGSIARGEQRLTTGEWPVAELVVWPRIVAALGAPVMRLFKPSFNFSEEYVAQQEPRFRVA